MERARLRAELDGVADRVKLHCGDIATLQPEPVDIVLSFAVLHHLPDRLDEVVPMIRSWLKPGGIFICVEPVCYLPVIEWMRLRSGIPQDDLDPGERKLTISDLECIAAGFTSIEWFTFICSQGLIASCVEQINSFGALTPFFYGCPASALLQGR